MTLDTTLTYEIAIKFAPIFTPERLSDPEWARPARTMYDRSALSLCERIVPLLADHDWDRVIGQVTALDVIDWFDGPWYYATGLVTAAPHWLRKGSRASFGFGLAHEGERRGRDGSRAEVVVRGSINEVSVLSETRTPVEPRAQVVTLRRASPEVVTDALAALRTPGVGNG